MREAFARAEEFFARDIDEKMKCATKSGRGYTREGAETLDVESSTSGDAKEGFYVGPDGAPWPDDFDEFRAAVKDYYHYAHRKSRGRCYGRLRSRWDTSMITSTKILVFRTRAC